MLLVTVCFLAACGGSGAANSVISSTSTSTTPTTPPPSSTTKSVKLTLSGAPATSVVAGSDYSFVPTASQSSGTVTFSITGTPDWASFDPTTGALTGTPAAADEGTSGDITITASDGSTTASIGPFNIDVTAPPPPPVGSSGSATLNWTAPTKNTDGTPLTDLAGYIIRYGTDEAAMTQSIRVSSAATTEYEISNLTPGTYYFEVIALSSEGTQSTPSDVQSKTI